MGLKSERKAAAVAAIVAFGLAFALTVTGCSASHWGGEATKSPGVEIRGPALFRPASVKATSDAKASVEEIKYEKGVVIIKNAKFGQDVSTVTAAQVPKIDAVARLQLSQAQYVSALAEGIRGIVGEIMPALKLLSLGTFLDLPGGGMQLNLPMGSLTTGMDAASMSRRILKAQELIGQVDNVVNAAATRPGED